VDAEFLKEIEGWREALAHNLALRNPHLTVDELCDSVQRTIDRIIFLRMAEDRGIEEYGSMQRLIEKEGIYPQLLELFHHADKRYNSGLFDFSKGGDHLTPTLDLDDKTIKSVLADLYFPQSPYEFSVLPVEILGNVYEQFLGKVIRLTPGHQARVEEKPEVKKAGGVYYTPAYIVDYIVMNTVGTQVEGRSPDELEGFRVLDPACGSGSFLLGAYQFLLDHYLKWYTANSPEKQKKEVYRLSGSGSNGVDWHLTTSEKKRILTEHIFGVDIDRQAVEVTKLSLLLKVLETDVGVTLTQQLTLLPGEAQERALPNLDQNIKCGNSLIGTDYFTGQVMPDNDELRRVNPFDWKQGFPEAMKAGGFDCVIGNPPYIRMEGFKELKDYLKSNYDCHDERSDFYSYFVERGHIVLKARGRFGMIISNKFLRANYGKPLRGFLSQNASIDRIVDLAGLPVFAGATVRTIILLTSRESGTASSSFLYCPPPSISRFNTVASSSVTLEQAIQGTLYDVDTVTLTQQVWSFPQRATSNLLRRLRGSTIPLVEYCGGQICMGVKSGLSEAFVVDATTRKTILSSNRDAKSLMKPFLNGRNLRRYYIDWSGTYIIYTYHGVAIEQYPAVEEHLRRFKSQLLKRATRQAWYELQQPQFNFVHYMDGPKIIFPDIAPAPRFALDEKGFYGSNTTYFIPRRDLYLLALLNSRLGAFYFRQTCAGLEGANETYLRFFGQYLEGFPVHPIDPSVPAENERHGKMVALAEQMLDLHKRLAASPDEGEQARLGRLIASTDLEIDTLVYELYGLTEEEVAIVEGANDPRRAQIDKV
jgi:hypothetical protein